MSTFSSSRMLAHMEEQGLIQAKELLNKLRHSEVTGMLWIFSEKSRIKKWTGEMTGHYVQIFLMTPILYTLSFPTSLMVIGMVCSVMPSHFFQKGLKLNAVGYTEVLETFVKPQINLVCNRKAVCISIKSHSPQSCVDPEMDGSHSAWPHYTKHGAT